MAQARRHAWHFGLYDNLGRSGRQPINMGGQLARAGAVDILSDRRGYLDFPAAARAAMDGNRAVSVDHHASSLTRSLGTRRRAKAELRLKASVQTKSIFRGTSPLLYQEVARVTGLEPATSGVTGRRSNQLSYTRVSA